MERNNRVATAVRRTLILSALTTAGIATPALAQENLDEIVVTGSRIRSANLEATTPVTQVTAADVVTQGVNRIEDLVNQLPQAFAAQNVNIANGSDGTATLNLRNLGSPRTLVLIDGRRMPYGSVNNSAANINTIPTQMIERVDVLTGGASAVYGSDAVAGVVNFVMKKDFEGVEITSQYNFYWHENDFNGPGEVKLRDVIAERAATNPAQFALPDDSVTDGEGKQLGIMMGVNSGDGRGNITAYASVFDGDAVLQRDRDYSACSLNPGPTDSFSCGGSSTNATGRFTDFSTYDFTSDSPTGFRTFDATLDQYNFGPLNHYQRPERRYDLGAIGHYEFGEHAEVYSSLAFNDYESVAQIAPGGIFIGDTNTINCGNPLIPAANLAAIGCDAAAIAADSDVTMYIGRRNVEGGGRQQQFANEGFRSVVGLRGAINDAWDYDASAQYSTGRGVTATANYFAKERIVRALDVVDVGGVPTCQSVIDGSDPLCVPYNPFVPGGVTQDQLTYLQVLGIQSGDLTQEIYNAAVTGDLGTYGIKSPLATDGIQVVIGTEYRRDTLANKVDALQEANALSGAGGATIGIEGAVTVREAFVEARVPIAQDRTGIDSLSFDTAYRYSDYTSGFGTQTDTYKFGLEWAPVADIRFRGSFQKAIRAANIVELFTAQGFNLFDAPGDPCGFALQNPGPDDPAPVASEAECVATGVPLAQFGSASLDSPAGQYQFLQGGSQTLVPEDSETQSFGIILQPRFAPGLSMTIDWFNIQIDLPISTVGAQNTLDGCYVNNDPGACARIHRTAGLGQLWLGDGNVEDLNTNIGAKEAEGIDLNLGYTGVEIGRFGSLNFSLIGTYFDKLVTDPGSGFAPYDCVGFYSSVCFTPTHEWRHMARVSWVTPWDVDLSLGWRYYTEVEGIDAANTPMSPDQIDRLIPAENYFDLSANWAVTEKANIVLGINNVLDDNPSISGSVGTTGNGNTYPQTYDALGRYVFLRATVGF